MILLLENNIMGGISSVMGDRYVKSTDKKKILYKDCTNLYCHSMSPPLPYDEIKFEKDICINKTLNTPDESDIGHFVENNLKYPDNIRQKTKYFPFCPDSKSTSNDDFNDYMRLIKPKNYVSHSKLVCDWTETKRDI